MPSSGGKTSALDRKSTRLNSSHGSISYAVFCLKKKCNLLISCSLSCHLQCVPMVLLTCNLLQNLLIFVLVCSHILHKKDFFFFFFFNDTATTEIYTLSLHDALPI